MNNGTKYKFLNRQEIVDKINQFSQRNQPFLLVVDFTGEKGLVYTPKEATDNGLRYEFEGQKRSDNFAVRDTFQFDFIPPDFQTYKKAFEKVIFHLKRGDSYLLNLTLPSVLHSNLSLDDIFDKSNAPYKLLIPGHLVIFSPEIFVRIRNSQIAGYPMKGTIDATVHDAEQILLSDEKEFFEHNTIVDLIRNDLSMVSTNVKVNRFRYIDRIHTHRGDLLQASSEISGDLPAGYRERLGDILFTLLPAGSVTGAPKERTVEIIRATESYDRGFYTGIFGFFDGQSLISAVSIRYIEQTNNGLVFKSGGGITALSEVESEYQEMLKKIYVPIV